MQAFEDDVLRRFRSRVGTYLRSHVPESTSSLTETELHAGIARCQERAGVHGIRSERAIAKWCYLSAVLGETFDEQPAIRNYLQQPMPRPDQKVDVLMWTLELRVRMAAAQRR